MHLYHASMAREDYELITLVRDGDVERDWNDVGTALGEKNWGNTEFARFQYYDGKNPGWPEQILRAEYQQALETYEAMRADERSPLEIIATNRLPSQPVLTKGLTQVTLGAPQSVYNGGLLRATVRYFDADRLRPGLPLDVAALVDELGSDVVGVQLVNTSRHETRRLIVQAGAFWRAPLHAAQIPRRREGWRGGGYCRREVLLGGTAAFYGDSRRSGARPLLQCAELRLPVARRRDSRAVSALARIYSCRYVPHGSTRLRQ